jgi:hypothetical protein
VVARGRVLAAGLIAEDEAAIHLQVRLGRVMLLDLLATALRTGSGLAGRLESRSVSRPVLSGPLRSGRRSAFLVGPGRRLDLRQIVGVRLCAAARPSSTATRHE